MDEIKNCAKCAAILLAVMGMIAFAFIGKTPVSGAIVGICIGSILGIVGGAAIGMFITAIPLLFSLLMTLLKYLSLAVITILILVLVRWAFLVEFGN